MTRLLAVGLVMGLMMAGAATAGAAELTVTVRGVRGALGKVELCLWDRAAGFPDCTRAERVARKTRLPAAAGEVVFTLTDVAPGTYAVSVFHDEKGTGKVETNFLGIPRVGVGASRDARGRLGPPAFADAAFPVSAPATAIGLTIVYP